MEATPNPLPADTVEPIIITDSISYRKPQPLDVLRGIGILFGLMVSVWLFAGFSNGRQFGIINKATGFDYRLYSTVSVLFDGKMRALIGLVFGAGLLLYMAKSELSKTLPAADFYIRRQMWLMAFGLLNAMYFLWPNDMLFQLGAMGILVFPFLRLSPKKLMLAATICLLIFCGKNYWRFADDKGVYKKYLAVTVVEKKFAKDSADRHIKDSLAKIANPAKPAGIKDSTQTSASKDSLAKAKKDTLTKEQADHKAAWEGLVKNLVFDPKNDEGEKNEVRETSYGKLWDHMLNMTQGREAAWTYRTGVWELGMSILLGMALLKMGFFAFSYRRGQYFMLAIIAIGIGLFFGWFRLYFHNSALRGYEKYITHKWVPHTQFIAIERLSMALGYAALVMWLLQANLLRFFTKGFAAVGRIALTNYLLQSIFLSWFFTGAGSGNFGKLNQWQMYFFVLLVMLMQIVLSVFWLRRYQQGPAEWLWRCAIAKKWLPFKTPHAIAPPGDIASTPA
ncbi:MAG: DUF418 domain-containing protein [Bacteroidota bacterium]